MHEFERITIEPLKEQFITIVNAANNPFQLSEKFYQSFERRLVLQEELYCTSTEIRFPDDNWIGLLILTAIKKSSC